MSSTMTREAMTASAPPTTFSALKVHSATMAGLARMGIETPTPIQARALPALLSGRDVIGQARTGSGKTLAFGIPAVEIIDPKQRAVQVLVLTPTRELAVQVGGVIDQITGSRGIRSVLIFGGRAAGPQITALRGGAHIVVGTPGRVLDLLNQGALDLRNVRFLVLDEADEMLDRGFAPDVERILSRTPRQRQTALFSATVPEWVAETAHKHLNDPVSVTVDPRPEDAAPIDHIAYDLGNVDKFSALTDLLDNRGHGQIIVFGRTKHGVKKLDKLLQRDGYPVAALQGNLSQNARDRVMEDFRAGRVQVLLATNVAARGLDITSVDLVINVDLPESPELLTHRVGRTGRMGRKGQAITLLGPEDGAKWRQLERGLNRRILRLPWPGARAAIDADITQEPAAAGRKVERQPAPRPRIAVERQTTPASPRDALRDYTPPSSVVSDYFNRPAAPIIDKGQRTGAGASRTSTRSAAAETPRPGTPQPQRGPGGRHQVTCSGCGQPAEVPFEPDMSRPVFCSDCFGKRRSNRRGGNRA
jgi:ATP-dependent RNA helicase DeaD